MARIVVCGYMIRHPVAGNLFAFFHYILGLHRLRHQVFYLEESGGWVNPCYDPALGDYGEDPEPGMRRVRALMTAHEVNGQLCYVHRESGRIYGAGWEELRRELRNADLLLNIGGMNWLPEFGLCGRRAAVDMDPFFTQLGQFGGKLLDEHQTLFSYGANIGRPPCIIPTLGKEWHPVAPPVVVDLWNAEGAGESHPFTTIASWNAYGTVTYQGESYGQKDQELSRLMNLPGRVPQLLEVALAGREEVREKLRSAGWLVRDSAEISTEVPKYQAYITASRGEFSVAKHAYVKTRSGWFSDRSVCYLAAGLPVVLQDTGFSDWLPTGRGVLAFSSPEEAAECLARIDADYPGHRAAARQIAEQFFDYRVVLPRLLRAAMEDAPAQDLAPVPEPVS